MEGMVLLSETPEGPDAFKSMLLNIAIAAPDAAIIVLETDMMAAGRIYGAKEGLAAGGLHLRQVTHYGAPVQLSVFFMIFMTPLFGRHAGL